MGRVYAEIELVNYDDQTDARKGRIKESEVRRATITFMVDKRCRLPVHQRAHPKPAAITSGRKPRFYFG